MLAKAGCLAVLCALAVFSLAADAAAQPLRTQAFYIMFQEQIQSANFPSKVCLDDGDGAHGDQCVGPMDTVYADGVFVAQPINMSRADVQKLKASVPGAVVLAYWCLNCIPIRPANSALCPCCTGHIMGDKPGRNCSTSYHCAESSAYQTRINAAFPPALARNQLFSNGSSSATCIYPGQAYYIPSAASVKTLAPMLAAVVAEAGFDGVYLDNYIHPDAFTPPHDPPGLLFDYDGDGLPDTRDEAIAQYREFAPAFSAALRSLLPEGSLLLANAAGVCTHITSSHPQLTLLTPPPHFQDATTIPTSTASPWKWRRAPTSPPASPRCRRAAASSITSLPMLWRVSRVCAQESRDVGTKPSVSVLWLTHGQCFNCCTMHKSTDFPFVGITPLIFAVVAGESMPAEEQCVQVARMQQMMSWVQAGTDFFDGSHIVCNATHTAPL